MRDNLSKPGSIFDFHHFLLIGRPAEPPLRVANAINRLASKLGTALQFNTIGFGKSDDFTV